MFEQNRSRDSESWACQTLLLLYSHSKTYSNVEVACTNKPLWGKVQLPCLLGHFVKTQSVKGNSYCCSMYSLMINLGNKKCTVLINDYILNETLWDFVRQEVLLECLWILRLLFCGLWFHVDIERCFWAIKLRDIMDKLGDLVSWVHKLCINTE